MSHILISFAIVTDARSSVENRRGICKLKIYITYIYYSDIDREKIDELKINWLYFVANV